MKTFDILVLICLLHVVIALHVSPNRHGKPATTSHTQRYKLGFLNEGESAPYDLGFLNEGEGEKELIDGQSANSQHARAMLYVKAQADLTSAWLPTDSLQRDGDPGPAQFKASLREYSPPEGDDHVAMRRRLGLSIINEEHQASTQEALVEAYGKVYRQEFADRAAVFYSHVSKSCGTTLCSCSWDSGCRAYGEKSMGDNCHAGGAGTPQDVPSWSGYAVRDEYYESCKHLAQYNIDQGYTLEANENYLVKEGLCPQFWNMIIIRDPVDRLLAHISMLSTIDPEHSSVPTGKGRWNPAKVTPRMIFEWVPVLADNYFIRVLLGKEVFALPFGKIKHEHFEKAKKVMDKFDLVLVKSSTLTDKLQKTMGFNCHKDAVRKGRTDSFRVGLEKAWRKDQWDELRKANKWDIALAEYASMLEMIDRQVYEHKSFAQEAKIGSRCELQTVPEGADFTNGTCGYLCK